MSLVVQGNKGMKTLSMLIIMDYTTLSLDNMRAEALWRIMVTPSSIFIDDVKLHLLHQSIEVSLEEDNMKVLCAI